MISNTSSVIPSFQLRLAVIVIISIGNILMLAAISTDYWIYGYDEEIGELHVGLWKLCVKEVCRAHDFIVYSKIILVITIVFGICCNIVAVGAMVYGVTNIKRRIARTMFGTGLIAMFGMGAATRFLIIQTVFKSIGYGLILGWIATVLYYVAALVSWIHYRREPDTAMTLDELRQIVSARTTQRPSYT